MPTKPCYERRMTRTEAITKIQSSLGTLPDAQLAALADMVQSWSKPTVFSTLTPAERADLDAAIDSLVRGEGVDLDIVDAAIDAKLKAAGV